MLDDTQQHSTWNQIVDDYGPRLYRYFLGNVAKDLAEDLVQETFIRLYENIELQKYQAEKTELQYYIFGIARIVRLEFQRKKRRRELFHHLWKMTSEEYIVQDENDPYQHLRWAIQKLNPIEQEIILLQIDQELDLQSISILVDCPLSTVKSHIHRAKEKLRILMEVPS